MDQLSICIFLSKQASKQASKQSRKQTSKQWFSAFAAHE
jgi:hypothetical protein